MLNNSINLIIATYAGNYNTEIKNNLLKTNLQTINSINTNISRITIMKPKIEQNHEEIIGFYDFSNINIDNIKDKIIICECENIGISYGQFFKGIFNDMSFDYYILIEDDYTPLVDFFEYELISEFNKKEKDALLCSFIYKNKLWDIINYSKCVGENNENIKLLNDKLIKYDLNIKCTIPDFSLCILSKYTVQSLINKFNNLHNILDIFNIKFTKIWLHQILFGYVLKASNINIYDISTTHLNIFYHTTIKKISTCNFDNYINNWKEKPYEGEKFKLPIFIPVQLIIDDNIKNDLYEMKKYVLDEKKFTTQINFIINNNDYIIREIKYDDFDKGYMNLIFEFTNYNYQITKENFIKFIDEHKNYKIVVIYSKKEDKIIGSGTIIIVEKIHNNPIGQIEDVIINEKYRQHGFGKKIIDKLIDIGKNKYKCYKIILNCLEKNIGFYNKCNFEIVGVEMKLKITF
jgi:glucosamine-phosphate N-acetyltransferase